MTRIVPLAFLLALMCIVMFRASAEPDGRRTLAPKAASEVLAEHSSQPQRSRVATTSEAPCCTHMEQVQSLEDIVAFKDAVIESERFAHRADVDQLEMGVRYFERYCRDLELWVPQHIRWQLYDMAFARE